MRALLFLLNLSAVVLAGHVQSSPRKEAGSLLIKNIPRATGLTCHTNAEVELVNGSAGFPDRSATVNEGKISSTFGYRSVLYVTNWSIYAAKFISSQVPVDSITHIQYAFADILENGTVISSDPFADTQKVFDDYTPDNLSVTCKENNEEQAHGLVEQLYMMKQKNRNLKVLLAVGGYRWSQKFGPVASDSVKRAAFVSSAVELMGNWGMDGIEIDWEYPNDKASNTDCVKLLTDLRKGLDDYAARNAPGYRFLLSFAGPAGPKNYAAFNFTAMDTQIDFWSIMGYDFAGTWDTSTGHQANVYPASSVPLSIKASLDIAVTDYMKQGVPSGKVVIGLPLYGRSFDKTSGLGEPYIASINGSFEAGVWFYKDLPLPGATVYYDDLAKAAYSFDKSTGQLISYDNIQSAQEKSHYLTEKQLGGVMFWEASQDKAGADSIVVNMARWLEKLESSENFLSYPASRYTNIRNNTGNK